MNKLLLTGILSVVLVIGIIGVYVPNAMATLGDSFDCINNGNSALAQKGDNDAEQQTEQEQAGDAGSQAVAPEFNGLTGNNLNLHDQQNGECVEFFDDDDDDDGLGGFPV
ncbi:MAG: hypothetical protein AB7V56_06820 [Candidatus Nitrosocosmicus sp.]